MKRVFKLIGITLASLLGLVLVTIAIVCTIVFTPKHLTPVVNIVADSILVCEHELDEVNLTFFKTFPYFGVDIHGLSVIHPMEGAPSDTVLTVQELLVGVDLMQALDGHIVVQKFRLKEAQANLYIDEDGKQNFDVLTLYVDTTEEDTESNWQLKSIRMNEHLTATIPHLSLMDRKDSIEASLKDIRLCVSEYNKNDKTGYCVELHSQDINMVLGEETYADGLSLDMTLPALMDENIWDGEVYVDDAEIRVNDLALCLSGTIDLTHRSQGQYDMDVKLAAEQWSIDTLFTLAPQSIVSLIPKDIEAKGVLSLEAQVQGVYDSIHVPMIAAELRWEEGEAMYKPLPYRLHDINLRADAQLGLNVGQTSSVRIHKLEAKTKDTQLSIQGIIENLLGSMLLDMKVQGDVHLPDVQYFLPEKMRMNGDARVDVRTRICLEDLTHMRLENGKTEGTLILKDGLHFQMDSLWADITDPGMESNTLHFVLPNPKPSRREVGWAKVDVGLVHTEVKMQELWQAQLGKSTLVLEASNVLNNDEWLHATLALHNEETLTATMDTIQAYLDSPVLNAYVKYNQKDSTILPSFDVSLSANAVRANLGHTLRTEIEQTKLYAATRVRPNGENILLKLNPKIGVDIHNAKVDVASMPLEMKIPQLKMNYSNRSFEIDHSQLLLGSSDLVMNGQIKNIGKWMRQRGILEGSLDITSSHMDVNELMDLFSADHGSEEDSTAMVATADNSKEEQVADPFLVPERVDLVLNTRIKEADVFNETVRNLGGRVYVKDGVVVLEEMGFVCKAAKLQLTAMYKTPRRNHLYVGLDYHMLDVNIEELIAMIPQLDTLVPMLKSFKGNAEFHLAAESYLKEDYSLKPSTIRGACSLFGKDLVVLDSETFSKIAKLLTFNKRTENKVDSISAEITLYKKEIDVYPFCVTIDKWMAALGGRHNLDMSFDYHVNLLSPLYLGVDVKGTLDDMDIHLAPCRYAKDFKPLFHGKVDEQSAILRKQIRESMRRNVKEQADYSE